MKYYSDLVSLRVFSLNDLFKIIGNKTNAKRYLARMCKSDKIRRIKKNLYSVIDLYDKTDLASAFVIASHINDNSFVSYHSAFEFYGFYNQTYTEMQVSSTNKFSNFEYGDYYYHCYISKIDKQIDLVKGVKVTSLERTIVDSINMLGKVMDVEELVKCLDFVQYLNAEKIKEMLLEYNIDLLYRKVGYVLSFYKKIKGINEDFFQFCKNKSNVKNFGAISYGEMRQLEFVSEWGIYAYKNLKVLTNKGENENV